MNQGGNEASAEQISVEEVQRLKLEPGDILVIRAPAGVTAQRLKGLQKTLEGRLQGHQVWVVAQDWALEIVQPAREADATGGSL